MSISQEPESPCPVVGHGQLYKGFRRLCEVWLQEPSDKGIASGFDRLYVVFEARFLYVDSADQPYPAFPLNRVKLPVVCGEEWEQIPVLAEGLQVHYPDHVPLALSD